MKQEKIYGVRIGCTDKKGDFTNSDYRRIRATDVEGAIAKYKEVFGPLNKEEYISGVIEITIIDA